MQMQPLKGRRVFYPLVHTKEDPVLNIYLIYSIIKQFLLFLFLFFLFQAIFIIDACRQ